MGTEVWGPIPEMAAMSCDTDLGGNMSFWKEETGSYQLPGGVDIYMQDAMDVPAWIDEVASRQEFLGWEVREENQYRETRVLYSPDGFIYTLTYFSRNDSRDQSVDINSFSPCFIPSSDFNPHLHY